MKVIYTVLALTVHVASSVCAGDTFVVAPVALTLRAYCEQTPSFLRLNLDWGEPFGRIAIPEGSNCGDFAKQIAAQISRTRLAGQNLEFTETPDKFLNPPTAAGPGVPPNIGPGRFACKPGCEFSGQPKPLADMSGCNKPLSQITVNCMSSRCIKTIVMAVCESGKSASECVGFTYPGQNVNDRKDGRTSK